MSTPEISIVIASYNRQKTLPNIIQGILKQELPGTFDFELIIVDNNSTDQTREVVQRLIAPSAGRLKYFKQEIPGKSQALNLGIQEARGEIIAFTDDDVEVSQYWLLSIMEGFKNQNCDCLGGRVLPVFPLNTPSWVRDNPNQMAGAVVIYDLGEKSRLADSSTPRFIGANWAFKKSIFKECGLFKTDIGPGTPYIVGEDEEFFERLVQKKKILYYSAEALIWHPVDLNRLKLKNVAKWHTALGHYEAKKEYENKILPMAMFAGIPRYLIKGIISDFFLMIINAFNALKFRYFYRAFYRKWGMIVEYQKLKSL